MLTLWIDHNRISLSDFTKKKKAPQAFYFTTILLLMLYHQMEMESQKAFTMVHLITVGVKLKLVNNVQV